MIKYFTSFALLFVLLLTSCKDNIDLVIPYPTNITFEELQIPERFSHVIPEQGFTVQGIKFNTVKSSDGQLKGGFCYSNRSNRSFVWNNTPQSIDSIRYSVWSTRPNNTGNYLVCNVNNDDAFFTLDKPKVIDYILVANTTWAYLAMNYGDTYGTSSAPVANPNIPSAPLGVWNTYVPGGVKKFTNDDFFTITIKGFKGNSETGTITFDLACKAGHNKDYPSWDYIVTDWRKLELSTLGEVDKVMFYLNSSDKDNTGKMRTPSWFCLDGFQLKE